MCASTLPQVATALRVMRAFKPLRMLTRSAGMRIVFKSVMLSMAAMANVSLVCVMFFLIFAILGTQLFMGQFHTWVRPLGFHLASACLPLMERLHALDSVSGQPVLTPGGGGMLWVAMVGVGYWGWVGLGGSTHSPKVAAPGP